MPGTPKDKPIPDVAGEWDLYTEFAGRYHWPPDVVDALDPDYVTEQLARWQAEAELEAKARKEQERANRRK